MAEEMKWVERPHSISFLERERILFKDFEGLRTSSRNYKIKNLNKVAELIKSYKDSKIRVIGDYDVDGMTSTSILILLSRYLKLTDFDWTVPKRFTEGYGLSTKIIDRFIPELSGNEKGLIITVDNGIAAIEAIDLLKEKGWTIIVLDHHLPYTDANGNVTLPNADIIIDPHAIAHSANFDDYCGAGLAYKLAQLIIDDDNDPTMMKITSLACIGTIGDSVQYIRQIGDTYAYDNYLIVKNGLETIMQNAGRTTGLYCLLRANGHDYNISVDNIAYTENPQLNAPSRLYDDGARHSILLLSKDDNCFNEADKLAQDSLACNELRKKKCEEVMPMIEEQIEQNNMQNDYPLIVSANNGEIELGIIGIVAGQLAEKYHTAAIVLTLSDGIFVGSARSPKGCNLKLILDGVSNHLLSYGGHEQAAGLKISPENMNVFKTDIQKIVGAKPKEFYYNYYDCEINPSEIDINNKEIEKHAPYGIGHEMPIFKICNYERTSYHLLGKNANVLKFSNKFAEAINFSGQGAKQYEALGCPEKMNLYGELMTNEWQGIKTSQIKFKHIEKIN